MGSIPIALQMYSLRDESEKDFIGTLKKVANMGYDGIESFHKLSFYRDQRAYGPSSVRPGSALSAQGK